MKRFMLLLAFLISVGTSAFGQLVKEVTLSSETNLAAALQNEELEKITTLKITGPLTEADFATMKDDMPVLQVLDMSGVTALPKQGDYQTIPARALEKNATIQKVIMPVCLESVGVNAFSECANLFEVDFSLASQLKWLDGFYNCRNLQSLDLSEKQCLQGISNSAFSTCISLKTVNLSNCSALTKIESSAFMNCYALKTVDLSNCTLLEEIGTQAFLSCEILNQIELTGCSALQKIGNMAFQDCFQLSHFDFEVLTQLSSIGNGAFYGTALAGDITLGSSINQLGEFAFYSCDQITSIDFSNSTIEAVLMNTFSGCTALQKVDFTGCTSLRTLNKGAFSDCTSLKEIVIDNSSYKCEDGVLYVGDKATIIMYLSGKDDADFTIPESVVTIQAGSFWGVSSELKSLAIPATVRSIEPNAFNGFSRKTVHVLSEQPLPLAGDIGLTGALVYVPQGKLGDYKNAEVWKTYSLIEMGAEGTTVELTSAGTLASKLTGVDLSTIQELKVSGPMNASDFEVIKQMTLLTKVDLSEASMAEYKLPSEAFSGLSYLKEVNLPDNITEIGSNAFSNLPCLATVNMPSALVIINSYAFAYCSQLEGIDLSSLTHLRVIGSYAFRSCSAIPTALNLPNSLESIYDNAFSGTRVSSVFFSNTVLSSIGFSAFKDCLITDDLSFPATLSSIGNNAFDAATPSSIKLKSPNMVSLGGTDVFKAAKETACKVNVPKGLGATYKADTYWSPFGNNIEEYGHLVTATTNNSDYGTVSGGGAYETGEQVTLTATLEHEGNWGYDKKFVWLFSGWYEGESKVSDNLTMEFAAAADRSLIATYNEVRFLTNKNYDFDTRVLFKKSQTTNSVTVSCDLTNVEDCVFAGWYENDELITTSSEITISAKANIYSRTITARIVDSFAPIRGLIDDSNKIDGQDVYVDGPITVEGTKTWKPNSLKFVWGYNPSLLVNSPMEVNKVNVYTDDMYLHTQNHTGWLFMCFPYKLKVTDILQRSGEDGQIVVREYDGNARATNGMGESWKQLGVDATMEANKGYIFRSNRVEGYEFNSSIDDMNKLFNRQAVTIPLPAHPSTVSANANWNLVGNPFPCYFSVEQLFTDGLDGTVTVWSDDIQNYEYYTQDDEGVYLAPLTAFFIQHSGSTSSVTFKPEGRVATLPNTRAALADLRSDMGREVINLQLANDSLSDKTRVVFNEAASTDYELGKDAAKFSSMNNNAPSLYSLDAQNQQLAINERPVGNGLVRLGCYIGVKGSYTLSAKEALVSDLYLYDTETGASCNLRETSYTFTAEAGVCNNRFELRTSLKGTGVEAIEGFSWQVTGDQLQLNGLPVGATVSLFDANGRMRFTGDATTAAAGIALPQNGIYYLIIRTAEGVSSTVSIKR